MALRHNHLLGQYLVEWNNSHDVSLSLSFTPINSLNAEIIRGEKGKRKKKILSMWYYKHFLTLFWKIKQTKRGGGTEACHLFHGSFKGDWGDHKFIQITVNHKFFRGLSGHLRGLKPSKWA